MKFKRMLAVALIGMTSFSLVACGSSSEKTTNETTGEEVTGEVGDTEEQHMNDTMVLGTVEFNGIFNPFFSSSAYDAYAYQPIFSSICEANDDNILIDKAGTITEEEIKDEAGVTTQVKYTITLKEGQTFSDGVPVTIDDVIFGYHVLSDPNYDGRNTFSSLDVVGSKEYYYDSPDYLEKIEQFETESETLSEENMIAYAEYYTNKQIESKTAEIINEELALGLDASASDFQEQVYNKYLEINKADESLVENAKSEKFNKLKSEYITANLSDGVNVTSISGIEKVDDLTCTVLVNGVNIIGDRLLTSYIMPKHHYGVSADGTEFTKGDMSVPKSRNLEPLGSGSYVFESYDNNIVSLVANPNYFEGAPKTPNVRFQVVSESNKVDVIANDSMDITDPSAQIETLERLDAEGIEYNLTDNNGYGYIGLNSELIPNLDVRKGLMHLMNRGPAIASYYGDLAEVIERPLSRVLAEYPDDAGPFYPYDKVKASEYFTKAGYAKDDSGKLVDQNGKQLKIEVGVSSLSSHPSAGILTQMKNDMTELGAEFLISDIPFNVLNDRIASNDLEMFVLAWGNSNNADLTQIFHSSSANGGSNHYKLRSDELDAIIEQVAKTLDIEERKKLVEQELDIIMENAVIMPVYQRKNLTIFNTNTLNIDTIYRTSSPFYTFRNEYNLIEMK